MTVLSERSWNVIDENGIICKISSFRFPKTAQNDPKFAISFDDVISYQENFYIFKPGKRRALKSTIWKWYGLLGLCCLDHEIFELKVKKSKDFCCSQHTHISWVSQTSNNSNNVPRDLAEFQNVKNLGQPIMSSRNIADFVVFGLILGDLNDEILQMTQFFIFFSLFMIFQIEQSTVEISFRENFENLFYRDLNW